MVAGSFVSAARGGKDTTWIIARPPGHTGALRPIIAMHGQGMNALEFMSSGVDNVVACMATGAIPSVAIVAVDGGTTYWHKRTSGEDAGLMVIDELLPMLPSRGLDTTRVAFFGWSMGGYAALRLGAQLGPARTAAICAVSPALFEPPTPGHFPDGAFDNAEDYAANTVWGLPALSEIPIRIDCGDSDDFAPATRRYIAQLAHPPAGGFSPGGHNHAFWDAHLPAEIAWTAPYLIA